MDKVVGDIDVLSTIIKLRVMSEFLSSLIVHADYRRRRGNWWGTSVLHRCPLHRRIIVMFPYIYRVGIDIASLVFAEELRHQDDVVGGVGERDVLRFGHGQGDNVLFSSFL